MLQYVIIALGVVVILAGGYFYYSQSQIKSLIDSQAKLQVIVSQQEVLMADMQEQIKIVNDNLIKFSENMTKIETKAIERNKKTSDAVQKSKVAPANESSEILTNNVNDLFKEMEELSK